MRSYSARSSKSGRTGAFLFVMTLLYLALGLPVAAAVSVTWDMTGVQLNFLPAWIGLAAAVSYPIFALIAIIGGWANYSRQRNGRAATIILLPLLNLALFGAAVELAQLL